MKLKKSNVLTSISSVLLITDLPPRLVLGIKDRNLVSEELHGAVLLIEGDEEWRSVAAD